MSFAVRMGPTSTEMDLRSSFSCSTRQQSDVVARGSQEERWRGVEISAEQHSNRP